jgi:hypothetical protein
VLNTCLRQPAEDEPRAGPVALGPLTIPSMLTGAGNRYRAIGLQQLRILRFGLLQDGNVGVSVFPEGEEVLVGGPCPSDVA